MSRRGITIFGIAGNVLDKLGVHVREAAAMHVWSSADMAKHLHLSQDDVQAVMDDSLAVSLDVALCIIEWLHVERKIANRESSPRLEKIEIPVLLDMLQSGYRPDAIAARFKVKESSITSRLYRVGRNGGENELCRKLWLRAKHELAYERRCAEAARRRKTR